MEFIRNILTVMVFIILFVMILITFLDWVGGCGEVYIKADGGKIAGECLGRSIITDYFR